MQTLPTAQSMRRLSKRRMETKLETRPPLTASPLVMGRCLIWLGSTQTARLDFKSEYTFIELHVPTHGGATANRLTMHIDDPACGGAAIVHSVVTMSKGQPVPPTPS